MQAVSGHKGSNSTSRGNSKMNAELISCHIMDVEWANRVLVVLGELDAGRDELNEFKTWLEDRQPRGCRNVQGPKS